MANSVEKRSIINEAAARLVAACAAKAGEIGVSVQIA